MKVVFLGQSGVGKTSLVSCFCFGGNRDDGPMETVGIDYFSKAVSVGGDTVKLQIWDTAGQEKYKSIVPAYIRVAAIAFVVYDVTDKSSYEYARECYENVKSLNGESTLVVLVANKIDLVGAEDDEEARKFAEANHCLFFRTSAKTGEGVTKMFQESAEYAVPFVQGNNKTTELEVVVTKPQEKPQSSCC